MKLNLTAPGGQASITDGAIAYPFVGSYSTGVTFDGLPYVVAPNGVKLAEPTPAKFTDAGRIKNGQMINPERGNSAIQALDNGGHGSSSYNAGLSADLNTVLRPGDSMLKVASTAALTNGGREGLFSQVSALLVVAAHPPAFSTAPVIWPSADAANRPWRVVDLDGFLSLQPNLSTAGQTIAPWSAVGAYFNRLDLGAALSTTTAFGGYECLTVSGLSDDLSGGVVSNYGRYTNRVVGAALTGLMSAGWSAADKTAAAIRILQRGCQIGEAAVGSNRAVTVDGGHQYGQYATSLAWLRATGRTDQYATWLPIIGGNIRGQYYRVTTALLASDFVYHTDPLKPYPYRARQVLSVTNGGLTVSVEGFIPGSGLAGDTASNGCLHGLNLRRNSDNAQAYISASSQVGNNPGSWTLTLTTPIAGLTAGDMVNCVTPWTMVDGDADFQIGDAPNLRNPSPFTEYRALSFNAPHHLYAHAIGMHGSAMNISRDYTIRAMQLNTPTPAQDYMGHTDTTGFGVGNDWATTFWAAHSATILAMPQIV